MTTPDDGAGRTEPPHSGDERAILNGFLDFHRETLQWKCAGLSPSQLATASCPPSTVKLLGMIRHITENERWWFQGFVDESIPSLYCTDDRDGDWHVGSPDEVDQALVDQAWADWNEAVAESRRVVAATDLDAIGFTGKPERSFSVRWVLTHMIIAERVRARAELLLMWLVVPGSVLPERARGTPIGSRRYVPTSTRGPCRGDHRGRRSPRDLGFSRQPHRRGGGGSRRRDVGPRGRPERSVHRRL